jgi:hypothetical protein
MEGPTTVPEKISNPINYKILIMITVVVSVIHFIINYGLDSENRDSLTQIISIINPLVAGITSMIVGFRYGMTNVFTRSYVLLGIGFLCVTIGETLYFIFDIVFDIDPFPSFADVFFLLFYPFVLAHLVINLKFFKPKYSKKIIFWLVCFPTVYALSFFTFYKHTDNIVTMITVGYVVPSSISLALAVVGANLFRQGIIGATWSILLIGMISISSADVWYSYLETSDSYSLDHPVNILWYAGYWIVTYALLKHKTSL